MMRLLVIATCHGSPVPPFHHSPVTLLLFRFSIYFLSCKRDADNTSEEVESILVLEPVPSK